MTQYEIFSNQEADQYFIRNQDKLHNIINEKDVCVELIKTNLPVEEVHSVIELGAADGYRLHLIKSLFPNCSRIVGTDLSQKAVDEGKKRYGIAMYKAAIEDVLDEEPFDLVIVNSVLHWVDRNNLFKAFYCIDRLVNNNKYLCVGDFCPFFPQKNAYHHTPSEEVYTFKQDYAKVFLASNMYQVLQKIYYAGTGPDASLAEINQKILTQYDRRCISLLHKNTLAYFF